MMNLYSPKTFSHCFDSIFVAALTLASPDNHSPAVMRHLTPTTVFSGIFISLPLPFLPSLHLFPLLISPSLSLPHQLPSNCSFSSHSVSDSQFMQWQDSSIFWKFEECCSVPMSPTTRLQSDLQRWTVVTPSEPS